MSIKGAVNNISWGTADTLFRVISSFIIGLMIAAHLGPESYGVLVLFMSIMGLYNTFTSFGMDQVLLKEWSLKNEENSYLFGSSLLIRSVLSSILLIPFLIFLYNSFNKTDLFLISLIVLFAQLPLAITIIRNLFISRFSGDIPAKASITSLFIGAILKICAVLFNSKVEVFLLILAFESLTLSLIYLWFYKRQQFTSTISFRLQTVYKILVESWPLFLSSLLFVSTLHVDKIIIWSILDNEKEFGIYGFSSRIYSIFHLLPGLILSSSMPLLVSSSQKDGPSWLLRCCLALIGLAILSVLLFLLFGEQIILLFVGGEFIDASSIIAILLINNIFISIISCWSYHNVIVKKSTDTLILNFIVATLSLAFIIYFTPIYGIIGTSWSIVIGHAFALFIIILFRWKIFFNAFF